MYRIFSRIARGMAGVSLAALLSAPVGLTAAPVILAFDTAFSGPSPNEPAPWLDATFQDVSPGTVKLTLSDVDLPSQEFISGLYLNLAPSLKPGKLQFKLTGLAPGMKAPKISTGVNAFKADGDGKYDVFLQFTTANVGRFEKGDYVTYTITGIPNLTAADFDFLSAPAGHAGPFLAAAHVQSLCCCGANSWICPTEVTGFPAPEPASGLLAGLGLCLWAIRRRERRVAAGSGR